MVIIRRVALIVLSLVVLVILFEFGLRIHETGQRRKILTGRSPANLGTMRADPPLLYRLKPGWKGRFNSHGFRDVERSKKKGNGVYRLAVVGDSVTMQMNVPREKLYGTRLQESLRRTFPDRDIECPAFAVTGYGAVQAAALMRDTVFGFDPDAILWQFHLNDAADPVIDGDNGGLGRYYVRPRFQVWATFRRKVDHLLRRQFSRRQFPGMKQQDLQIQAWRWDKTGIAIDDVAEMSASKGIPVFVVVFPAFPDGGDWQEYTAVDNEFYGTIIERFRKKGFPTLDLMPVFKNFPVAEIQRAPGDTWHPNVRGHRVMARAISRWLTERGLLDDREMDNKP